MMTLLKAKRPEFIDTPSLNLSPVAPVFLSLSEPAKSTKLILKVYFSLDILLIFSTMIV
jgi:hypothetical protein